MRSKQVELYLTNIFNYFDEDNDGKISATEIRNRLGLISGDDVALKEAEEVVESSDSDGDGFLSLEDIARLMEFGEDEDERVKDLRAAFGMYVDDHKYFDGSSNFGSDHITPKSLKRMLSRLGESKSVDECKIMISCFDLNGDGVLSFEEFRVMMG